MRSTNGLPILNRSQSFKISRRVIDETEAMPLLRRHTHQDPAIQ